MRRIGMIGVLAALVAASASADDAKAPCLGLFAGNGKNEYSTAQGNQLFLTDNQCEAVTRREFRLQFLEIPQDDEDPMTFSLGLKNGGGILRFKIPFSF